MAHPESTHPRIFTWDNVALALMCLFMVLAPMPSFEVTQSPVVTFADVAFVLALGVLFPTLIHARFRPNLIWLIGSAVLITIGILCIAAVPDHSAVQGAMRLAYEIGLVPTVFALWRPDLRTLGVLGSFYVLGATISVLDTLTGHPDASGRYEGLSLHPNGMAAGCVLALAVIPLVVETLPRLRWAAAAATAALLYGLWISGSRGALIALAFLALAYTVRKQSVPLLLTNLTVITVAVYVAETVSQTSSNALARLLGGKGSSDADGKRALAVAKALTEITHHPLLGAGFQHIREAQNSMLEVAAAIGVPAMLAFFAVLIGLATPVLSKDRRIHAMGYPAIAFLGLALTSDTVSDTFAWAPLGLAAVVASRGAKEPQEAGAQPELAPSVQPDAAHSTG